MSVPENTSYHLAPSMTGEAALYRTVGTGEPAGATWTA